MGKKKIVIGTRGSKLALWQAQFVGEELKRHHPGLEVDLTKIKTTGDMILDVPLAKVGGKGLFVKEIEEALLSRKVDIAVHSMKDVPTEFPEGLHLAAICEREDPRDAFISQIQGSGFGIQNFSNLPRGAKIGTSSLRRSCQLLSIRPDLSIHDLRGNLDTRLRKLDEGQFDAIILACAGVKRLGLANRITEILPFKTSLPAVGQGAVGIECRLDDEFVNSLIAPLNHGGTSICVKAERSFLKRLEGGCQVPIAAHARIVRKNDIPPLDPLPAKGGSGGVDSEHLILDGLVGSVSGDRIIRGRIEGRPEDAERLGMAVAEDVLSRGAKEILDEVYRRL
ncbi:MAG: hydroxymethylbilane synthase [Nitrospirota bacterium]